MKVKILTLLTIALLASSILSSIKVSPKFPIEAKIATKILSIQMDAIFDLGKKFSATKTTFTTDWGTINKPLPVQSYSMSEDFQSSKTFRFRSKNSFMELVAFSQKTDLCIVEVWFDRFTQFHGTWEISQTECQKLTVSRRLNRKDQQLVTYIGDDGFLYWTVITAYREKPIFKKFTEMNWYSSDAISESEYYDVTLVTYNKNEYFKIYQKASDLSGNYPENGYYFSIDTKTNNLKLYPTNYLFSRGGRYINSCLDNKASTQWHNIVPALQSPQNFYYISNQIGQGSCYTGGIGFASRGRLYNDKDRYDVDASIYYTTSSNAQMSLTYSNNYPMFSYVLYGTKTVVLGDATQYTDFNQGKFNYGRTSDTSMVPLAQDEYLDDIEPRFDYVYVLRSRVKGSRITQNEQVLSAKDVKPGIEINTGSNRYSANFDTLMSVPRSFKSRDPAILTFADSPNNERFGYWLDPGATQKQGAKITAKDTSMSSAVTFETKFQFVEKFQTTQVNDDEQYLSFTLSDVGKTKIFYDATVNIQADRIRLKNPDTSETNWITYTYIAPLDNNLKIDFVYSESLKSEMYRPKLTRSYHAEQIYLNSYNIKQTPQQLNVNVVCGLKDVVLYEKDGKIDSFSQRIYRGNTELGPNAFRIDLSTHNLSIQDVTCSNEANLVMWKGDKATYAMSWDIGGGSNSGEFYIRKFYTELDISTVTFAEYSQSAFSYRLTTKDDSKYQLSFNQAYPMVHLGDQSWFGTDQSVTKLVKEVGHDNTDIQTWDIHFTIKKPRNNFSIKIE